MQKMISGLDDSHVAEFLQLADEHSLSNVDDACKLFRQQPSLCPEHLKLFASMFCTAYFEGQKLKH